MSIKLTFLSANRPLTKTLTLNSDGTYTSIPYPLVSECTSHEETIISIEEFYDALIRHSKDGHALLKGNLQRPINQESRAGLTKAETTQWVCVDFDGLKISEGQTAQDLLIEIGFGNVDHIVQYSASHKIKQGLSAHVFVLLDKPIAPEALKQYLKHKNLTIQLLRNQLELTRTGTSLHYPMDISVADLSRLIYVGIPNIIGGEDPVGKRIELVKGSKRKASLTEVPLVTEEAVQEVLSELRRKAGLPEKKFTTKLYRDENIDVVNKPDRVSITGEKTDGDFTRLNINGSASWGYYIVTSNPEIIFNFRGETPVLLKEVAPDYYKVAKGRSKALKREAHSPKELGKVQRWVINRKDEGKYYKVEFNPVTGLSLNPAPTVKQVQDWCVSHNILAPEIIEDWEVKFDPTTTTVVDSENKVLNTYRPSTYKTNCVKTGERIPEEYWNLINWICGGDKDATVYFINWLAYIWQTGKRPKTSFVFSGTYGTGKGRFLQVLKKLFGNHCVAVGPEAISDTFNEHLESAQIVWLDELTTDSWDSDKMTPKLRALIDGEIGLRAMRKGWRSVELFFGLIIAANEHYVVEIRHKDRRFNVAPRQEKPLIEAPWVYDEFELFDDEFGIIYQEENLQRFANALQSWQVDIVKVRRPMLNEAKEAIMRVTQSLPQDIVTALEEGNVGFFLDYIQEGSGQTAEGALYNQVVEKMVRGGKQAISVRELVAIFDYLAGWRQPPGKFTKAVSRFGLDLKNKVCREGSQVHAGTYFTFYVSNEDKARWAQRERKLELVREPRTNE